MGRRGAHQVNGWSVVFALVVALAGCGSSGEGKPWSEKAEFCGDAGWFVADVEPAPTRERLEQALRTMARYAPKVAPELLDDLTLIVSHLDDPAQKPDIRLKDAGERVARHSAEMCGITIPGSVVS
ncbi:hypothetical protein GCM10027589_06030 [Actinocorallia lasiicapitis]